MDKQEEILEDFESYLWESGRIGSKATLNSYLGNVRQILAWLKKKEKNIEDLGIETYNHKFRHTLATRMVRKGNINLKVVQELLGHSSIDTVFEYYVASNQEELRQALEDI